LFAEGVADSGTDALLLGYPGGGDFVATPVCIREVGELNGPDIYRTTTLMREMNTIRGAVRQMIPVGRSSTSTARRWEWRSARESTTPTPASC